MNVRNFAKVFLFLRRVLSRISVDRSKAHTVPSGSPSNHEPKSVTKINVEAEVLLLKEQLGNLQRTVETLLRETEKKEVAIANLAREKERLTADLRRQQKSNSSLKNQLEEERNFYYREKEQYCQEMNDCKKFKKSLKGSFQKPEAPNSYKKEMAKLNESLTQTLEANYNLSVKFLRMKNTKYCIKNRLKKLEVVHKNVGDERKAMKLLMLSHV